MKKSFYLFSILSAVALMAFTAPKTNVRTVSYDKFIVDSASSIIKWEGKKVTGAHSGTIALKKGEMYMSDGKLQGGNFVADMASITVTDLSGKGKANLESHLKDDDFFDTENFPTAKFSITKIGDNGNGTWKVTGNMTIKDSTKVISFDTKVTQKGKSLTAVAEKVVIDRTKFGVKYKSKSFDGGLGDKFIYDDFELNITLKATKK